MNPGGIVLVVVGVVAVLIGVRGSQSQTFAAITGKGAGASSLTSRTNFTQAPAGPPMNPSPSPSNPVLSA